MSDKEFLLRMHKEIRDISRFGDNAVVRRIQSVLETEMLANEELNHELRESGFKTRCGPFPLGTKEALYEYVQEDRRRSVFIDPKEIYFSNMMDLYEGRLNVVEFRNMEKRNLEEYDREFREYARGKIPIVKINLLLYSKTEVVNALQSLLQQMENDSSPERDDSDLIAGIKCSILGKAISGSGYVDGGDIYYEDIGDWQVCKVVDECCKNEPMYSIVNIKRDFHYLRVYTPGVIPRGIPTYGPNQWVDWDNTKVPAIKSPAPNTKLTSKFGWRIIGGSPNFHGGIDAGVPVGTEIVSSVNGTVDYIFTDNFSNNCGVVIISSNRVYTFYHIDAVSSLKVGDHVSIGTTLGKVSSVTGNDVVHFHYSIHSGSSHSHRNDSTAINPLK